MAFAIICVDDEPIVLASLGEQLGRALGQEHIESAANASAALALFAELQAEGIEIPVIISDQKMPGISGDKLLTQIHLKYPQTLTILLTGQSSVEDIAKAVNSANLYRYIAKPWDETDLILTIETAVRYYFQQQEIIAQQQALDRSYTNLIKSVSLLRAILESTADGILVVDRDDRVTHYNQKLTEIWELDLETTGKETLTPGDRQILDAIANQIQDPPFFADRICQWHQPSNSKNYNVLTLNNGKTIECYSQPQRLGGDSIGRVWSFRDITAQRSARDTNYDSGVFDRAQIGEQLALEQSLSQAIEREEFSIYYQPQVDTATGKITHMEAMLQWQHPQLGAISPDLFIPIAERKGSILRLGQWLIHQACAQAVTWQSMGLQPITMAVNLYPQQLWHRELLETIAQTLVQTGLQPQFLELEIPETAMMRDIELAKPILLRLNQLGIKIALDDFGTGYSALRYLKQLPFQTLKIDRSFVGDLHSDRYYESIVDTLLRLGQRLNIRVVAQGVESIEVKNLLHTLQCHHMQGDWFNYPLTESQATQVLRQNSQTFDRTS
jgi:EAL domain-containing protein (putative c-di-GMP-specific phosphodiesterase class I)/FixJ family two-component response regulator